ADGCLDDVGQELLVRRVIAVAQVLAGELGVAAEVVVRAVVDTLHLLPAEWKLELDIRRRGGVVRALVGGVVAEPKPLRGDTQALVPLAPTRLPLLEEARRVRRAREVLHLHLFELARAEDEVPGRDLVAESLADLRDAEGDPLA